MFSRFSKPALDSRSTASTKTSPSFDAAALHETNPFFASNLDVATSNVEETSVSESSAVDACITFTEPSTSQEHPESVPSDTTRACRDTEITSGTSEVNQIAVMNTFHDGIAASKQAVTSKGDIASTDEIVSSQNEETDLNSCEHETIGISNESFDQDILDTFGGGLDDFLSRLPANPFENALTASNLPCNASRPDAKALPSLGRCIGNAEIRLRQYSSAPNLKPFLAEVTKKPSAILPPIRGQGSEDENSEVSTDPELLTSETFVTVEGSASSDLSLHQTNEERKRDYGSIATPSSLQRPASTTVLQSPLATNVQEFFLPLLHVLPENQVLQANIQSNKDRHKVSVSDIVNACASIPCMIQMSPQSAVIHSPSNEDDDSDLRGNAAITQTFDTTTDSTRITKTSQDAAQEMFGLTADPPDVDAILSLSLTPNPNVVYLTADLVERSLHRAQSQPDSMVTKSAFDAIYEETYKLGERSSLEFDQTSTAFSVEHDWHHVSQIVIAHLLMPDLSVSLESNQVIMLGYLMASRLITL
jgi:hypothetical protein